MAIFRSGTNAVHVVVDSKNPDQIKEAIAYLRYLLDHPSAPTSLTVGFDDYMSYGELKELFLQDVAPQDVRMSTNLFGQVWGTIIRLVSDDDPSFEISVKCTRCGRTFSRGSNHNSRECRTYSEPARQKYWQLGAASIIANTDAFLESTERHVRPNFKNGYRRLAEIVAAHHHTP